MGLSITFSDPVWPFHESMDNLTPAQKELLEVLKLPMLEEDAVAIRRLAAQYFAKQVTDAVDAVWEKRGWTSEHMDAISNGTLTWDDLP